MWSYLVVTNQLESTTLRYQCACNYYKGPIDWSISFEKNGRKVWQKHPFLTFERSRTLLYLQKTVVIHSVVYAQSQFEKSYLGPHRFLEHTFGAWFKQTMSINALFAFYAGFLWQTLSFPGLYYLKLRLFESISIVRFATKCSPTFGLWLPFSVISTN